ncbi:metallophosphoesterase [Mesorhizobium sp. BAC0120]|uniref:metallophosphoesterase family protein n=1 Tax=Mesorhizobium sp. BAC0120 TaxID=3090670 RepID=UPI00298CFDA4|nr:metallophosphoesterase [Mesorhizobium sp. BAC0120]MDW6022270.1 metallophosphoesterase [Mesorhizobium sp. BAC0120]
MFRLAHLSDIHLGPLPDIEYHQLVSKRVLGYVNWQRNRSRFLHDSVIEAIVTDMKAGQPDHVAVTGDLVNLALDREIELARLWLETLGEPHDISVVPGNHDAYVPGALDRVCRAWGPWMGNDVEIPVDRHSFPYVRVRRNVALIGVTSARATAPFMANGFFRSGQAHRLAEILEATSRQALFRIVMIHHPPVRDAVSQAKRLFGIDNFQRVIRRHGAELVLHGHSHLPSLHWIDGKRDPVPVVGVAAAGQSPGGRKPAAQYNLIEIDGEPERWRVKLSRRGLTGPAAPIAELETVDLYATAALESAAG